MKRQLGRGSGNEAQCIQATGLYGTLAASAIIYRLTRCVFTSPDS